MRAARLAFGMRAGACPRGAGTRLNRELARLGKRLAREEQASERHKETIRRQYDEDIQLRAALRRLRDQSDRVRSLTEEVFWLRIALDGAKAGREALKARLVKLRAVGATLSKLTSPTTRRSRGRSSRAFRRGLHLGARHRPRRAYVTILDVVPETAVSWPIQRWLVGPTSRPRFRPGATNMPSLARTESGQPPCPGRKRPHPRARLT